MVSLIPWRFSFRVLPLALGLGFTLAHAAFGALAAADETPAAEKTGAMQPSRASQTGSNQEAFTLSTTRPVSSDSSTRLALSGTSPRLPAAIITPTMNPKTVTISKPAAKTPGAIENSVVKVFSTVRYPDLYRPWTKQSPSDLTASGVVIEGKRILTNAHAVEYASRVEIQANQAGDKISATVVAFARGIDLAILKLDDETFFDTHPPLPRASKLPEIKDAVMAYGYPKGGDNLSITKGIVSRIEFAPYNYPVSGLRIQIDDAINPGNSGEPPWRGTR